MADMSFERRAYKELLVWGCAAIAGFAIFSSFEPFYDAATTALARAGFKNVLGAEAPGTFNAALLPAPSLDLRRTIAASPAPAPAASRHKVTLIANSYGHFHAGAEIDGHAVEFMTDTGATYVALSYETARELGIAPADLHFTGRSTTANGVAHVASVVLHSVTIGDITVHDVQAVIGEPGRMSQNLLGMSFIGRLSGFELSGTKLVMTE